MFHYSFPVPFGQVSVGWGQIPGTCSLCFHLHGLCRWDHPLLILPKFNHTIATQLDLPCSNMIAVFFRSSWLPNPPFIQHCSCLHKFPVTCTNSSGNAANNLINCAMLICQYVLKISWKCLYPFLKLCHEVLQQLCLFCFFHYSIF